MRPPQPRSTLFPYTTLFRSVVAEALGMRVIFYDTAEKLALGNAKRMPSLHSLLAEADVRSEEHTSELQSRGHLVCRLLLEKKKETTVAGVILRQPDVQIVNE